MMETIVAVLFLLWALGLLLETSMGSTIHILLITAIFIFLIRVSKRRKAWD